jgi:hypothetical protein
MNYKASVWVNNILCSQTNAYRFFIQDKTLIISPHVTVVPTQTSTVSIIYTYRGQPFHQVFTVTDSISHFELLHCPDSF